MWGGLGMVLGVAYAATYLPHGGRYGDEAHGLVSSPVTATAL